MKRQHKALTVELTTESIGRFEAAYNKACARKWRAFAFNGERVATTGAGKMLMYMRMALENFKNFNQAKLVEASQ